MKILRSKTDAKVYRPSKEIANTQVIRHFGINGKVCSKIAGEDYTFTLVQTPEEARAFAGQVLAFADAIERYCPKCNQSTCICLSMAHDAERGL